VEDEQQLLTRREAAQYLGVKDNLLARWAMLGKGPSYIKMGEGIKCHVRYAKSDLLKYIDEMRRNV